MPSDDAVARARAALQEDVGSVIRMVEELGCPVAHLDALNVAVHGPDGDTLTHAEDVAETLRGETLDWLDGVRSSDWDGARMPALADFVALSSDDELVDWVREQIEDPERAQGR